MPACSLDDAGRDRPARFKGLVVAEEVLLAAQVSHACVRAGSLASRQAGGGGLGGDRGGGPAAAAGQHRERLDRDPVLGGGIAGRVKAPCRFP
jgi:hypothetical protein